MKEWSIELYVLDQDGKEHPAKCFTKVVFHLHPSFANPDQSKPRQQYACDCCFQLC